VEHPTTYPTVTTEWDASVSVATREYIHYSGSNVYIHDLTSKARTQTIVWPDGQLQRRAPLASPDGRMLVGESSSGGGAVQVVDRTGSGALLAVFDNAEVVGWRWTPGSDLILVVVTDDTGGII